MATLFGRLFQQFEQETRGNKLQQSLFYNWIARPQAIPQPRNFSKDLLIGYLDNEVIYSIINKIAETAADVPIQLVNGKGEPVTNHWLSKLLDNPNSETTFKELVFNYYVYLLAIGNSYIYAPKLENGITMELWTVPSDLIEIVSGPFYEPIKGYKFIDGRDITPFTNDEILHGKLFNPRFNNNSWEYGLSPISVSADVIRGLNAGIKRQAALAETGGPPYIISAQVPEGLTPQQQEQLEDTYKKKYKGIENTNEPMLSGTPLKVDQLGSNAADLDLIKSSEFANRVLCNVYGVSSMLFNDNENSTYNNVSQARKDLYQFTVQPLNTTLEQKLKQFLVPTEDVFLKFDYGAIEVLQEAIFTRVKALETANFLSVNEKRTAAGFPERGPEYDAITEQTTTEQDQLTIDYLNNDRVRKMDK